MTRITRRLPVVLAIVAGGLFASLGIAGAAAPAPENTAAPTVSGNLQENQTLTADAGTWTGTPTPAFTYAWERCDAKASGCSAIKGAADKTYKLQSADIGHTV